MVALDERHHTFLQALMKRGPLPEEESKQMFRELFYSADEQFFEFLSTVNKELDYLQMEVRGSRDQYSSQGTLYYGLVNKLANEEAKLGTRLTPAQLTFFKAILEAILSDTSATGSISSMQALNLRLDTQTETQTQASTSQAAPVKLTLGAKQETQATLVSDDWLGLTDDGKVCLGTKSFLELRSFFKNFEVPFCDVCNEAAIKAQPCQNEECTVRMHLYCVPRKFSRRQVPRVCPGCSTAWRMLPTAGDASDQDPDHEVDAEEEEEEEDTRVRAPAPTRRTTRATRASQGRLKAKLEESSDEQNDMEKRRVFFLPFVAYAISVIGQNSGCFKDVEREMGTISVSAEMRVKCLQAGQETTNNSAIWSGIGELNVHKEQAAYFVWELIVWKENRGLHDSDLRRDCIRTVKNRFTIGIEI